MTDSDVIQQQRTYVLDNESAAERARLLDQDKMLTEAMGGLFAELDDEQLATINDVLDIGCGPGGWAHEVARAYPTMQVTGIDISKRMIDYAKLLRPPNTHFQVMDALKSLAFPDASFDLINIRTAVAYVPTTAWPSFLADVVRVLRPGGVLRISDAEGGFTNKPNVENFSMLSNQAMQRIGRGFSPNGKTQGMIFMLKHLLRQAGLQDVITKSYILDASYGEPAHEDLVQNCQILFVLAQSFFVNMQVTTPEKIRAIAKQALVEMQETDFCCISILLTTTGIKPTN